MRRRRVPADAVLARSAKASHAGDLKELALEDDALERALAGVPTGEEVDPATWWAISVNNLKISMRAKLTVLPAAVARLSGLRTLILSDNSLRRCPGEIARARAGGNAAGERRNQIAPIPDEIANCKNLGERRADTTSNRPFGASRLRACLVTLVVDGNALGLWSLCCRKNRRLVTRQRQEERHRVRSRGPSESASFSPRSSSTTTRWRCDGARELAASTRPGRATSRCRAAAQYDA